MNTLKARQCKKKNVFAFKVHAELSETHLLNIANAVSEFKMMEEQQFQPDT